MKLVWNAIVKNEGARIKRCVDSLLPHIDGAVVVDTGSTDDTIEQLDRIFKEAGKPLEVHHAPFENFEQARNVALDRARASALEWDYLLLSDADMELVVHKPEWNKVDELGYDMKQYGGGLSGIGYFNKRLISRKATGKYVGVTHEYLDVVGNGTVDGAFFIDHADGANRTEKHKRDIRLLKKALKTETSPGMIQRYHFYLAQSYRDGGNWQQAAEYYRKRIDLGGWDEEVWNAQVHYAYCLRELGKINEYVIETMRAYEMRPQRTEPLYDLARFFRETGRNHTSLLFSVMGMSKPRPDDKLFVNESIYTHGLREEFAICAYYDAARRDAGAKEASMLSLQGSSQARGNLFWYLKGVKNHIPSFKAEKIDFTPPPGYVALNPSVISFGGTPMILIRTVNYTITYDGQYRIRAADGSLGGDHPIITRNFIGPEWKEIELPVDLPVEWDMVIGFEDSRLFEWNGQLWTSSSVRQLNREGLCEQVLAPITFDGDRCRYGEYKRMLPKVRTYEKNWMPWVDGDKLSFVHRLGTMVNTDGEIEVEHGQAWDVGCISGSSQVVDVGEYHLAIVHEAGAIPGRNNRYYRHRFALFRKDKNLHALSAPFYFHDKQIEFAAGLAYFPDKGEVMVSYGVRDCEAWTATMNLEEVVSFTLTS